MKFSEKLFKALEEKFITGELHVVKAQKNGYPVKLDKSSWQAFMADLIRTACSYETILGTARKNGTEYCSSSNRSMTDYYMMVKTVFPDVSLRDFIFHCFEKIREKKWRYFVCHAIGKTILVDLGACWDSYEWYTGYTERDQECEFNETYFSLGGKQPSFPQWVLAHIDKPHQA